MRNDKPRVDPVAWPDLDVEAKAILQPFGFDPEHVPNILATLAHHPKLLKRWRVFAKHVLVGSTLPPRERELIILRTGYDCASGYEWAQHVALAREAGLNDDEIERITRGSTADGWCIGDRLLLAATDELINDRYIATATWHGLAGLWDVKQLMDIVFTVGQYAMVSMALNTFGVQIESEIEPFPSALFEPGRFPADHKPATGPIPTP